MAAAKAGGQILLAAALKRRRKNLGIMDWHLSECERMGVDLRLNTHGEAADIKAEVPDCVALATDSMPSLDLLSAVQELATTSQDILSGSSDPAKQVIVINSNGGHSAMTIAEYIWHDSAG